MRACIEHENSKISAEVLLFLVFLKEFCPAFVFALDDFVHFFRCFCASSCQPHLYDGIKSASEKLYVIVDEPVAKMIRRQLCIIFYDFELIIVPQFKVCLIEQLIFGDMPEQLQIIVAVEAVFHLIAV